MTSSGSQSQACVRAPAYTPTDSNFMTSISSKQQPSKKRATMKRTEEQIEDFTLKAAICRVASGQQHSHQTDSSFQTKSANRQSTGCLHKLNVCVINCVLEGAIVQKFRHCLWILHGHFSDHGWLSVHL